jgi:hypothetical protein
MATPPATSTWNVQRDIFIKAMTDKVDKRVATELVEKVAVRDVHFERASSTSTAVHKLKIRVVLLNDTDDDLIVTDPSWVTKSGDVKIQGPRDKLKMQVEGPGGWEHNDCLTAELTNITVPARYTFRLWVSPRETYSEAELRRRHERKQLGTLVLPIRIRGHDVRREFQL